MQKEPLRFHKYPVLSAGILCLLIFILVACGGGSGGSSSPATNNHSASSNSSKDKSGGLDNGTSSAAIKLGNQPCPAAVSSPTHWDPIVPTQANLNKVESVTCANLLGVADLQALVTVRSNGSASLDAYVYDKITSPSPTKVFMLMNLQKGDIKISGYNTLITAEVDPTSSVNQGQANAGLTADLHREFKWSDGARTLVPVAFPGLFPDTTRYAAEADQQDVNQGHQPWKLDAGQVAVAFADNVKLLQWTNNAQASVVSGGGQHDENAVVNVKSPYAGAGTIKVSMSRLENNANGGIWIVTDVTTDGMSISTPVKNDGVHSPVAVSGKGNAFEGRIGKIFVLNHLYDAVGNVGVTGSPGNGNATFSVNVPYSGTFRGGAEDGLVVLYSYSNADGTISGVAVVKVLLG